MSFGHSAFSEAPFSAVPDAGVAAYSLAADAGAYSVSGTAATLKRGYKAAADAGSYAVSGTAATLRKTWKVVADAGSYAVSGTAATLRRAYPLSADAGSYAVSGSAASLLRGYKVSAAAGSYAVNGTAASFSTTRILGAEAGSYAVSGSAAGLRRGLRLDGAAGSYTLTGSDASLVRTGVYALLGEGGAYALNGEAAALLVMRRFAADPGAYSVTGSDAELTVGVTPTPVVGDTHDGKPHRPIDERELGRRERNREREQVTARERLKESVERAYRRAVHGEETTPVEVAALPVARPATKAELKRAAPFIRDEIRTEGFDATLKDIQGLLAEFQAQIIAERQRKLREDEALLVLMLAS